MIDENKLIEDLDNSFSNGMIESFDDVIGIVEEQPKVGEWIPCSEKLPNSHDICTLPILKQPNYLIYRGNGLCAVAKYEHIYNDCWINEHSYIYKDVIAWMPLPPVFKGE